MSQYYDDTVAGETIFFWFAANETTGTGGDGASPLFDVRLGGAAAGAAPTASGSPTLLTHADYSPGSYEIAIDTIGYANGHYGVFCSLTISTVNPGGFVGSFRVRTANRIDAIKAKTDNLPSDPADQSLIIAATDAIVTLVNDVPNNSEFDARTLPSANYATASAQSTLQTSVDDVPNNSEFNARTLPVANYATAATQATLQTAVDDIPNNAEAAAAHGATLTAIGALTIPTAIENADAWLDRNMATGIDSGSPTVRTPRQAFRALRNKFAVVGTTRTVYKEDDETASWTSEVTTSAGAQPIVADDPAGP